MNCFHCGDKVVGSPIVSDDKNFCCQGCSSVYNLLKDNGLDNFYQFNEGSGVKPTESENNQFAALDVPEIFNDFIEFQNDDFYIVTFFLPAIHCSSCIYLLENLQKLNPEIIKSEANFTARTLQLSVKKSIPLSKVAQLLDSIGYKPELRQKSAGNVSYDKKLLLKLGLAGFAFGSVMLWTFPEYLGLDESFESFRNFSAYLSLLVSIPVFFYSASDYMKSAWTGIKTKQLNLDLPIAIGIIVLFVKSSSSVLLHEGFGYMDSFTGFVFFLLIGKWFQSKTYRNMSFDNDPKAYFPLGVHRIVDEKEEITLIDHLKEGDTIRIYNEEVIPCDVELLSEKAVLNNSFITGEADLIQVKKGDRIYSGGKIIGSAVLAKIIRTTDRSKFAGIWNKIGDEKPKSFALNRENKLTKVFLIVVFTIASGGAIAWWFIDPSEIVEIVTAVLVVACPCALALSFPFVYGNAMRKFGNHGFYFKNVHEIEKLHSLQSIVFDKTGTLTKDRTAGVNFQGLLSQTHIDAAYALTKQSTHPYSKSISTWLSDKVTNGVELTEFEEIPGKGVQGKTATGDIVIIGSDDMLDVQIDTKSSGSWLKINEEVVGKFVFQSQLREGVPDTLRQLNQDYAIHLLSGDNPEDAKLFTEIKDFDMRFNQSPTDKRAFVEALENSKKPVAYIGDGLNDSEALNKATLGISVADDVFRFTPSCDAIIAGDKIQYLPKFMKFGNYTAKALVACMVFSLIYNTVGMTFALLGYVTPLFAAILMPLSSITIVLLSTLMISLYKLKTK
jgi:P-type Cu+ transporter